MNYFVFRNMTIESLFAFAAKESGCSVSYSGYEDISDTAPDADIYVWWYLAPMKAEAEQAAAAIENYASLLELTLQRIESSKMFVALTIEPIFEVTCLTSKSVVKKAIETYNGKLHTLSEIYANLRVIDFSSFTRYYSFGELLDWKYYFISQMALSPKLGKSFGGWFLRQMQAIKLIRKKCLVLDLDNTLWGGILGEDGIFGVKIGGDYPGNAYQYFQRYILELKRQGVIIAVCSKNNLNDVEQLWAQNTSNLITSADLSAHRINWQDKATNIRELADELNIGLDSMVFVDDNPTERELVKSVLPMVSVPDFVRQPYELPSLIERIASNYFSIYILTQEDMVKTEQYKANAERVQLQSTFTDMEDYLHSLQIELTVAPLSAATIERAAQLTQKTNQFNLTTRRYSTTDLQSFIDNGAKIWTLSVSDKFGDSGLTGLLIATVDGRSATIDTLLLSCRVLGKNIEYDFVKQILSTLSSLEVERVEGHYIPTAKNGQTADFYDRCGFEKLSDGQYIKDIKNYSHTPKYTIQ